MRKAISSPNRHAVLPTPARDAATALLRDLSGELALLGVTGVALFGSVARGEDTDESDLDIAVTTTEPENLMSFVRVRELVEAHCGRRVDVVPLPLRYPLTETAAPDLLRVA